MTVARVFFFGAVYLVIGVVTADLASGANLLLWRRMAWLLSAFAFAAHIAYEQFRHQSSHRTTALRASIAAAIGACGLAASANIHWWTTTSSYKRSLLLSLVAWPLLVIIPAFGAALIGSIVLDRIYRRT